MGFKAWRTPKPWFQYLHSLIGFTIDAAADDSNALLSLYWTKEHDALKRNWDDHRVYCNPPYENLYHWVSKAANSKGLVFMVLPADPSTAWFQDFLWDGLYQCWEPEVLGFFPRGRLKFVDPDNPDKAQPMHANLFVIFNQELLWKPETSGDSQSSNRQMASLRSFLATAA